MPCVRDLVPWSALACALALLVGCGAEVDRAHLARMEAEARAAHAEARDRVLPSPAERRWEEIEWLPTYADGLRASAEEGKPLLLWVMNGHPLGCT